MIDILILVEGKHDKHFVDSMIELWFDHSPNFKIQILQGKQFKPEHRQIIEDQIEKGCRVVLIMLDADKNFAETKENIESFQDILETSCHGLQPHSYIFPNNKDNGNLETLLENIANPQHQQIFECFEQYENCLKKKNENYHTPNQKAKIYAYLEAQGLTIKENKRDYTDENFWNLEHDDLQNLRIFLEEII